MADESESGVSIDSLTTVLQSALNPSQLRLIDVSGGCGAKFELYIAAELFNGQSLINRHRLVQSAITTAGLMNKIHALTIKAWTPTEWETKKDQIPKD